MRLLLLTSVVLCVGTYVTLAGPSAYWDATLSFPLAQRTPRYQLALDLGSRESFLLVEGVDGGVLQRREEPFHAPNSSVGFRRTAKPFRKDLVQDLNRHTTQLYGYVAEDFMSFEGNRQTVRIGFVERVQGADPAYDGFYDALHGRIGMARGKAQLTDVRDKLLFNDKEQAVFCQYHVCERLGREQRVSCGKFFHHGNIPWRGNVTTFDVPGHPQGLWQMPVYNVAFGSSSFSRTQPLILSSTTADIVMPQQVFKRLIAELKAQPSGDGRFIISKKAVPQAPAITFTLKEGEISIPAEHYTDYFDDLNVYLKVRPTASIHRLAPYVLGEVLLQLHWTCLDFDNNQLVLHTPVRE